MLNSLCPPPALLYTLQRKQSYTRLVESNMAIETENLTTRVPAASRLRRPATEQTPAFVQAGNTSSSLVLFLFPNSLRPGQKVSVVLDDASHYGLLPPSLRDGPGDDEGADCGRDAAGGAE